MTQFVLQLLYILAAVSVSLLHADVELWWTLRQLGLICKQGPSKIVGHNAINDIIAQSLASAGIPTSKEPTGLTRLEGKHPDGITVVPWQCDKPITWDVTVVNTLAQSMLPLTRLVVLRNLPPHGRIPNMPACPKAFFLSQSHLKQWLQLPLFHQISCVRWVGD